MVDIYSENIKHMVQDLEVVKRGSYNYLSITPWRRTREWRYRSTFSSSRHYMEVRDQLHSPYALPPGKDLPVPNGYEVGWASEPGWRLWSREKCLGPAEIRKPVAQPILRQYTDSSIPDIKVVHNVTWMVKAVSSPCRAVPGRAAACWLLHSVALNTPRLRCHGDDSTVLATT
jgi:hypothetical protein